MSLTGAHRGWPTPCCTALLVGPAAGPVMQTAVGCNMGAPGRSAVSTVEAAAAGQRNAVAQAVGPQGEIPDDPAPQEKWGKNMRGASKIFWPPALYHGR